LVRVRGTPAFRKRLLLAGLVFCGGAVLYWVALGYLHEPVLHWLYGGKYDSEASTLWLLGLLGVASAIVAVCGAALRALERPDRVFWAYMGSSLVAVAGGVLFISLWQVRGAALGLVVSSVATAVGLAWYLRHERFGEAESHD
jgi:O-antigen/teichoic acid export membrane protein